MSSAAEALEDHAEFLTSCDIGRRPSTGYTRGVELVWSTATAAVKTDTRTLGA
jgi:hypothetical protein